MGTPVSTKHIIMVVMVITGVPLLCQQGPQWPVGTQLNIEKFFQDHGRDFVHDLFGLKAIRPDAPQLGDSLFGAESACSTIIGCAGSSFNVRSACAPIVLMDTGPHLLTASGPYCLGEDLHAPVVIEGSNITLDLNGFTIYVQASQMMPGVWIQNGVVDVRVHNGLIVGSAAMNSACIIIGEAYSTRLEDITCTNGGFGIVLLGPLSPYDPPTARPFDTFLNRVICQENGLGLIGLHDVRTHVRECVFSNNFSSGFVSLSSDSTLVEYCVCNNNRDGGSGIQFENVPNCEIINCVTNENGDHGISFSSVIDSVVRDCTANFNTHAGFNISGASNDVSLFNCVAQENESDGFALFGDSASFFWCTAIGNGSSNNLNGFNISSNVIALVRGCTAEGNFGYGFNNNLLSNQFYSNAACLNGLGSYNNVDPLMISSPANVRGVHNVDCTNITPDEIETILTALDGLTACDVTLISDIGGDQNQVLNAPGRYCLSTDIVNSRITIAGNSIELDLNNHVVQVLTGNTGITVASGFFDIAVYNGYIDGGGLGATGIAVETGVNDVRIEDIVCRRCDVGMSLDGTTNRFQMSRVRCADNTTYGLLLAGGASKVVIVDSMFANSLACFLCSLATDIVVADCAFSGGSIGCAFNASSSIEVRDCIFEQHSAVGLSLADVTSAVARRCVAMNSLRGFLVTSTPTDVELLNSVALNCSDVGFLVNGGIGIVIRECVANNNSTGFNSFIGAALLMYANNACYNATNYSGIVNAAVVGAAAGEYWQNIDCTLP